jgi:hypothetical protein
VQYLEALAHNEHFLEYRSIVTREIEQQLEHLPPEPTLAPIRGAASSLQAA